MGSKDLTELHVSSGVNEEGVPFVHIFARSGKEIFMGQQTPQEIRGIAMQWIEAAEAAMQDAIVFKMLRDDLEMPLSTIGGFIQRMREMRDKIEEDD